MDLQAVSDKIEITELLARYARAVDEQDFPLWRSVFTDTAYIDYRAAGGIAGQPDEVAAWLAQILAPVAMTEHYLSNVEIDLDGGRARVRAMFWNPIRFHGSDALSYCGGYYAHEMVRTEQGWKSERLVERSDWMVNLPPANQSAGR